MEYARMPDWYWSWGLHDAKILSVTEKKSNWNPRDCQLIFKLDGDGAIYESDITEIRFYNYKILTADFDLRLLKGGWWLSDELSQKGDRYLLALEFDTAKCKTRNVTIKFEKAEVVRK